MPLSRILTSISSINFGPDQWTLLSSISLLFPPHSGDNYMWTLNCHPTGIPVFTWTECVKSGIYQLWHGCEVYEGHARSIWAFCSVTISLGHQAERRVFGVVCFWPCWQDPVIPVMCFCLQLKEMGAFDCSTFDCERLREAAWLKSSFFFAAGDPRSSFSYQF